MDHITRTSLPQQMVEKGSDSLGIDILALRADLARV